MATDGVEAMVIAGYVPLRTVTVGIPFPCAYEIASPMAVNWPRLSGATVTAGGEAGAYQS